MSNEQPEALKWAEWLEHNLNHYSTRHENFIQAAAELRRLHEVNQELVEALERLAKLGNGDHYGNSVGNEIARAVLAKAKGETE